MQSLFISYCFHPISKALLCPAVVRSSTNTYQVTITSNSYSTTVYSTNNSVSPGRIAIGQELTGINGATAPQAYFGNNKWFTSSGVGYYQSNNGYRPAVTTNSPFGTWVTLLRAHLQEENSEPDVARNTERKNNV